MIPPKPTGEAVPFDKGNVIYEIDPQGYITYANRTFMSISQYDKSELLGTHYSDIIDPHMPKALFKCMQETTAKDQVWQGYVKNLRADGAYYWSVAYVTPKKDDKGEVTGFTAMYQTPDLSMVKEINQMYKKVYLLEQRGEDTCDIIKNFHLER